MKVQDSTEAMFPCQICGKEIASPFYKAWLPIGDKWKITGVCPNGHPIEAWAKMGNRWMSPAEPPESE